MDGLNFQKPEVNGIVAGFSSAFKISSTASGLEGLESICNNLVEGRSGIAGIVTKELQESGFCDAISSVFDDLEILPVDDNPRPKRSISQDILGEASEIVNSVAANWNPTGKTKELLSEATSIAIDNLVEFQNSPEFFEDMEAAFGEGITLNEFTDAIKEIIRGEASIDLKIVDRRTSLNSGAFAADTNTIYFLKDFLNQNKANPENVANVLLEEWGHYLDVVLNNTDSEGDEGEIFANSVKGFNFDFGALKMENDYATLGIGGNSVKVEQAAFGTITLPTSWVIFRSVRGSILAFKRDGTVSALTDIYSFINGVERQVENVKAPINFFNGQFKVTTRTNNTTTTIRPDGTIGFRPGFIQPRLTFNAPLWTRIR